jgi:hypothetical protein
MNETLTEKQSLGIIQEMIQRARNQYSEDGSMYLLWGWTILFCSMVQFLLDVLIHFPRPWAIWSVTWVVAVYMIIQLRRKEKSSQVRTYTEELIGSVWLAFVIMMIVTFFVLMRFVPEFYRYNFLFILICYGMPTFISGAILQFRPLVWGGVVCWLMAAAGGFVNFHYHPLFIAFAVVSAWIIPGYMLRAKYKRSKQ